MKIQLTVDRTAALLAGHDHYGPQTLEIDPATLSHELRQELATCDETHGVTTISSMVDGCRDDSKPWPSIAEATPDAVVACLHARIAIRAGRAQVAAETLTRLREALPTLTAHVEACEAAGHASDYKRGPFGFSVSAQHGYQRTYQVSGDHDIPNGPERQAIHALADRLSAVSRAAEQRQEDADRAASAAALQRLRAWVEGHGSERAQLLLEEEHASWQTIASHEYLQAHIPEGYATPPLIGERWEAKTRTKPTASDIRALRAARTLAASSNGVLTEPRLAWCVEHDTDYDEDSYATSHVTAKYPAVVLTVVSPTGTTIDVVQRLS